MIFIHVEKTDVLVIGSGGAGLRAALELHDQGIDVLVVGKCKKGDAHTVLATGGINAALGTMDPSDNWKIHAADTLREGAFINDPFAVTLLCKNASQAVQELAKWGVRFHRERNGKITQRFFGAATYRRACFFGDYTGKEILRVLVNQIVQRHIRFKSEVYIFSLLHAHGVVNGALGLDIRTGTIIVFHAKVVLLATGGHSRMFMRSSSRFWENTGDGISLAYHVGAHFMDMEMFQFHPTGMLFPKEAEGLLVTEAVRGEGGVLTNNRRERFMKKYDSQRMELSARDVVARAIYTEVQEGRGTKRGGVWLDISHLPKSVILKRLPQMYQQFKQYVHIDISQQKMEVAPTAHYSMGGVFVNHMTGETTVSRLFALGEVTSGVHGANRLGGNSLAEIIVFGKLTGRGIARHVKKMQFIPLDDALLMKEERHFTQNILSLKGRDPLQVKEDIQSFMWKCAGVVRHKKYLTYALQQLTKYQNISLITGSSLRNNEKLIASLDVRNMLPTCDMILRSALYRTESRGAHYRSDYPQLDQKWRKNVMCIPTKKGILISSRRVLKIPKEIQTYLRLKPRTHLLE